VAFVADFCETAELRISFVLIGAVAEDHEFGDNEEAVNQFWSEPCPHLFLE